MNNIEALKKIAEIQHRTWQVYHYINDEFKALYQLSKIKKSQYEIKNVGM